jgi:hypothetical protein
VITAVNQLLVEGGRAVKNGRKRQGNKGRKTRRGRPRPPAQQPQHYRKGTRTQAPATFLWDHQSLIVRKEADLRAHAQQDLALLWQIAPALKLLREFNQQLYRLFARGMTTQGARSRRRRLVHHRQYQAHALLAKALKQLSPDKCDKMSVLLGWAKSERPNNHVERNNRVFRMMPKTRYKRRKAHTLEKALALALYARMLAHPLDQHDVRALPVLVQETAIVAMAA